MTKWFEYTFYSLDDGLPVRVMTWNIDKAVGFAGMAAEIHTMSLADAKRCLAMNDQGEEVDQLVVQSLTPEQLAVPVIAIHSPAQEGRHIVIDGWHRLNRHVLDGNDNIPVVMLTPEQEQACRILDRQLKGDYFAA